MMTIKRAHAFCSLLPTPPPEDENLGAYFTAHVPVFSAVIRALEFPISSPLFPPKTILETGEINWDSVDSLTSRYYRTDVQVRSTLESNDWRSLFSVLLINAGHTIETRVCATRVIEQCLDAVRESVRASRKDAPAA